MQKVNHILINKGILYADMGIFSRGIGILFGPIGWLLIGGWIVWNVLGPAYRVTIPAVIQVAYMRVKYQNMLDSEKKHKVYRQSILVNYT